MNLASCIFERTRQFVTHLRRTWCNSAANEVKNEASASTKPPITAVSLVLPRRHAPTTKGADPREIAVLNAPTHAETLIRWLLEKGQTRGLLAGVFLSSVFIRKDKRCSSVSWKPCFSIDSSSYYRTMLSWEIFDFSIR